MKRWYTSKTVWIGIIEFGMGVSHALANGADAWTAILTGLGVVTVVARAVTTEPLKRR